MSKCPQVEILELKEKVEMLEAEVGRLHKDGEAAAMERDELEDEVVCQNETIRILRRQRNELEAAANAVTEETKESRKRYGSTMSFAVVTKIDKLEKLLEGGE